MCVPLDECVPRKLHRELSGHEVKTVAEMGWSGTKNSALLRLAVAEVDVRRSCAKCENQALLTSVLRSNAHHEGWLL